LLKKKLQAVCKSKVQQKCCENVFVTIRHEGAHHLSCTVGQKSNCQLSYTTDMLLPLSLYYVIALIMNFVSEKNVGRNLFKIKDCCVVFNGIFWVLTQSTVVCQKLRFVTVFTKHHHWAVSWITKIALTLPHCVLVSYILISYSKIRKHFWALQFCTWKLYWKLAVT